MKRKMFLIGTLALMVAGGIFWSCQKDEMLTNPENGLMLKSVISNYPENCADVCIDLTLGDDVIYYQKTGQFNGSIGGNSKSIRYKVYNTENAFFVELSYSRTPESSNSTTTINLTVNGSSQSTTIANGGSEVLEFPLADGWKACDNINWNLEETVYDGGKITGNGSYALIGICSDCEPGFTYADNEDGTYTFTLVPEKDIEDAELVFTFAQSAYQSGLPVVEGWVQAGNEGQVRKTTMDLVECEKYTWTVTLTANCSGNSGASNVWTDFKINNISQKANSEDKFVQFCP